LVWFNVNIQERLYKFILKVLQRTDSIKPTTNRKNCQNFKDYDVKFTLKSHHKGQINDCVFLSSHSSVEQSTKLPFICSVSSDNCLKVYSLEDRSLFRSYKVSNFNVSSIDFVHMGGSFESNLLLFLSCWDNSVYIYDINFNRCIHTLEDLHEDAISRVRILEKTDSHTYFLTASWDSLIKLWCMNNRTFKTKCLNEICHDSACSDLTTSRSHLAILCKDGNLYQWKTNTKLLENDFNSENGSESDDEDDFNDGRSDQSTNYFTYLFKIQNSNDIGEINDARIFEDDSEQAPDATLAVCTSLGYVKIYNIENNTELFSLRVNSANVPTHVLTSSGEERSLRKILYTLDYIVTVGANGYVYFIDLKQDQLVGATNAAPSFLAHCLRVSESALTSLSVFDDRVFSLSDSEGSLYLLSCEYI
jgi:hypothetical protein